MRVLIDATAARLTPHSGTGVYLEELSSALGALDGLELRPVINPRRRPPGGGSRRSARNLAADLWWYRRELPRRVCAAGADLVHHPRPPLALVPGVVNAVTVQDLAFERLPECFDPRWRRLAHHTHRAAARGAGVVIAISHTTGRDIRELWGMEAVVAPLGPGQLRGPCERRPPRHFLYVGDGEPRKNLPLLLDAYARYRAIVAAPLELVLAGSAAGEGEGVSCRSSPGARELAELFAAAAALAQPSRYEGFGLTALEAMAAGVPVLAARSPGLTEVCADAALYASADTPEGWAQALAALANDRLLREDRIAAGCRRAGDFSWAACARAHRAAYSLCLDSR